MGRHVNAPDTRVAGALVSGTSDKMVVSIPLPSVVPENDGYRTQLQLADIAF